MMNTLYDKFRRALIYNLSPVFPTFCSRIMYIHRFHRPIHLRNPRTLNEKIMWLKLNDYRENELVTSCADKYMVRKYVEQCGCGDILNELLFVWDTPDEINWDSLPDSFVLKCNHGCGYNLICSRKSLVNKDECLTKLRKWYATEYWRMYAELQYKDICKKIICEKYIGEGNHLPIDYKVYCFNGEPLYILVCENRESGKPKFYFFDTDWKFCPITHDGLEAPANFTVEKPRHLSKMLDCAKKLSSPFPYVRVDFYETNKSLVFGELTFTPAAALDTGRLPETDIMFGKLLKLNKTT